MNFFCTFCQINLIDVLIEDKALKKSNQYSILYRLDQLAYNYTYLQELSINHYRSDLSEIEELAS